MYWQRYESKDRSATADVDAVSTSTTVLQQVLLKNIHNYNQLVILHFHIKKYGSTSYVRIAQVLKWPLVHKA